LNRSRYSAAVLAGGKNSRMNVPKAFLDVGGRPIIQRVLDELRPHFGDIMVIANEDAGYTGLGVPVYPDLIPGRGPLSGIHAALSRAAHPCTFVVACDMPFVNGRLARLVAEKAEGWDCAVPKAGKHPEPLFAAYTKSCLPAVNECLEQNRLKVMDLLSRLRVNYIEEDLAALTGPGDIFFNVNNPQDLSQARALAQPGGSRPETGFSGRPPLFCVVGTSNSGKTLLVTRLVQEFRERGFRVGTVKHCPHGADMDVSGKDSWQHSRAGAELAMVTTPGRVALFRELPAELSLEEVAAYFRGLDLLIVEGYKHLGYPKILVRSDRNWPGNPQGLFALVGPGLPELDLPVYDPEDVKGLAAAVVDRLGLNRQPAGGL